MSLAVWLGFLLASILIAVTPGPGAVLSMSIGMRRGWRSAFVAILGLQTALLVHVLIVAIGFGALLAASELAFGALKFAGAAYLVWLGIQKWRAPADVVEERDAPLSQRSLFLQGLLVNLTNPKAIIFVGALLPQFVTPSAPLAPQYLLIAATLCLTDTLVMSSYALAARRLGAWMHDPQLLGLQNKVFGGLFVTAGSALALSSRS